MPLPKASFKYPLMCFMHTFGPITMDKEDDEIKKLISMIMKKHYNHIEKMIIAIEFGKIKNDDTCAYKHAHVAMKFNNDNGKKVQKSVYKSLINSEIIGIDENGRKPNIDTHSVRKDEANGKSSFSVLEQYLTDPSKIKMVDDEIHIEMNPSGNTNPKPRPTNMSEKSYATYRLACLVSDQNFNYVHGPRMKKDNPL